MNLLRNDDAADDPTALPEGPIDDPLSPHGRQWLEVPNVPVELCSGARYSCATSLNWTLLPEYTTTFQDRPEFHYFRLLFPWQHMNVLLTETNIRICRDLHAQGGPIDTGSFLKYLGIQLAKAVDPSPGDNSVYWTNSSEMGSTSNPKCFNARFGMSRHRFDTITKHLALNTLETPEILRVCRGVIHKTTVLTALYCALTE